MRKVNNNSKSKKRNNNIQSNDYLWNSLANKCAELNLHKDPTILTALESLKLNPHDSFALQYLSESIEECESQQILNSDPFKFSAPTVFDDVDERIVIGQTINGTVFGINAAELTKHCLTVGYSGSGKTCLILLIIIQILEGCDK